MQIETLKVLVISTAHITRDDGERLIERTYSPDKDDSEQTHQFTPATDLYGHWLWAGTPGEDESIELQCAAAEDEGYSSLFINVLRVAVRNGCSHVRFDRDGPTYKELPMVTW